MENLLLPVVIAALGVICGAVVVKLGSKKSKKEETVAEVAVPSVSPVVQIQPQVEFKAGSAESAVTAEAKAQAREIIVEAKSQALKIRTEAEEESRRAREQQ